MKSQDTAFLDEPRFHWLVLFRLANLWLVRTWFVPDEYFQSVEIAYQKVYGIGHITWEWDAEHALRSFIHPSLFMLIFYPLKLVGLDSTRIIQLIPHLIHSILFAVADFYMAKLVKRLFKGRDSEVARFAYLLYLSNWFVLFCAPRTLSNSLETILTIIGLNFYPLEEIRLISKPNRGYPFAGYAICAALACLIRPTSVLIWAPLGFWHLWSSSRNSFTILFRHLLPPALLVFFVTALIDVYMYQRLTLPAWNFIKFNVLSSGSANFGVNPFYWYLTEGIPPVFTLAVLPLFGAVLEQIISFTPSRHFRYHPNTHLLFYVAIFYVVFHSFIAHKEHRFLLPIVPLVVSHIASYLCRSRYGKTFFLATVILQIPLTYYFCVYHQKAPAEIIDYLNAELKTQKSDILISQLMPCYSMPQYAAIHPHGLHNTRFKMLDCTPKFGNNATLSGNSQDESDLFHYDPINFVRLHWNQIGRSNFIIAFERPFKQLEAFLRSHGYVEAKRFYNTHFPVSNRQDSWIVIATRK